MTSIPPTAPGPTSGESSADLLRRRSFNTYLARLKARERLARREGAWTASLVALTTSATVASVGMLSDSDMYGKNGDLLLVCVSILTLVASLVTSGLKYSERSRDMFVNYRQVQRISLKAEAEATDPSIKIDDLWRKYNELMDQSENHTAGDHHRAKRERDRADGKKVDPIAPSPVLRDDLLTYGPYVSLLLAIVLAVPLVNSFFQS